jgi:transposase
MKGFSLTPEDVEELRSAHRSVRDKRHAYRINAIILLGTGWTEQEVSDALLLDPDTLRRNVSRYQSGGVDQLLMLEYRGSVPKLTAAEQTQLNEHLLQQTYLRVADIASYIQDTFSIEYSVNGLTDLLHRMGFVYKKPKVVPGKANADAQRAFLDEYETLKQNKGRHDPIYFMDAVHPQHNTVAACGWIKRGVEKQIPSNTGRQRINMNGAINIEKMQAVTRIDETINAESTVDLFKQIQRKHRKAETIYIICDNARYYRSKLVQAFIQTAKIQLVFLPPYSPNLNLIERLWKYFRKQVMYNRYYERFEDFKSACLTFFENIPKHKQALRKLLTENFQIIEQIAA